MKSLSLVLCLCLGAFSVAEARTVPEIKAQIMSLAESFKGQGDQDYSKQNQLEPLVRELLVAAPQPPLSERFYVLVGPWKQIFGPYVFNTSRASNPSIDADNIYQVISKEGFYYNVSRVGRFGVYFTSLFKGVYKQIDENTLSAQFIQTAFLPKTYSSEAEYVSLPGLVENKQIKEVLIPSFLSASILAQKGSLKEVYTDETMRIMYGSTDNGVLKDFIYVLRRVQ